MTYTLYIVQCSDKTLYTGITNNLKRRIWQHNNSNKGAIYTKYRRPVGLVYKEESDSLKEAMRREREIKSWSRLMKLELINKKVVS